MNLSVITLLILIIHSMDTMLAINCGAQVTPSTCEALDCYWFNNQCICKNLCSQCLSPDDPNEACVGCDGIANSNMEFDNCGQCLAPDDPNLNSCVGCDGIANSNMEFDNCGQCLAPDDPNLNSCVGCD
eukprot:483886_1